MAESKRTGRTWLAYGCFGCAGIIGILVISVGALTGVAALRARSEEVVDRTLTQAPLVTEESRPTPPAVPEGDTSAFQLFEPDPVEAQGRLVLDLTGAEFHIEPAEPGEPLSIKATYDEKSYELVEQVETPEGEPWTYKVRFDPTGGFLMTTLKQMFSSTQPRVFVKIPPDVALELDVRVDMGAMEADLGGLWLTDAALSIDKGAMIVAIGRPLRQPMEHLELSGSMGAFIITGLGNASPGRLDVNSSQGALQLDMRGKWLRDSDVTVIARGSGVEIQLPDNVLIEGLDRGLFEPRIEAEIKPPTLRFSADSRLEDVEFSH